MADRISIGKERGGERRVSREKALMFQRKIQKKERGLSDK